MTIREAILDRIQYLRPWAADRLKGEARWNYDYDYDFSKLSDEELVRAFEDFIRGVFKQR